MNTTQHTPGPWHIKSSGIVGNTGFFQYCIAAENGWDILSTKEHVLGSTYAELEANARLIAAAPELLSACRFALDFLESPAMTERQVSWDVVRDAAKLRADGVRAAIAHATGKEQQ